MFRPIGISVILALAGCGGSGSSKVVFDPGIEPLGDLPVEVVYDADTDTYTVTRAGIPPTDLDPLVGYEFGTFRGAAVDTGFGNTYGIFISESDDSSAVVYVRDSGSSTFINVTASRQSPTELPTSGSASYMGDYTALVQLAGGGETVAIVIGDAELAVDFDAATLSGAVRNRVFVDDENPSLVFSNLEAEDLLLDETSLDPTDGSVNGVTSGGQITESPGTASEDVFSPTIGNYAGLIAGPNGDEFIVGLELTYSDSSFDYEEYGAIAAGH